MKFRSFDGLVWLGLIAAIVFVLVGACVSSDGQDNNQSCQGAAWGIAADPAAYAKPTSRPAPARPAPAPAPRLQKQQPAPAPHATARTTKAPHSSHHHGGTHVDIDLDDC
ncbi:hypothetical protein ACFVHS_25125 [Streptomyces sp. NPDC057746]|uniref:hypothetical protein n=1 Tax=Streptomyces sp. NPDC057746 TaxID=3346237 RepID=UPI00369B2885